MNKASLDAALAVLSEGAATFERLRSVLQSDAFAKAVDICHRCSGSIVVIGMGKSGIVGQKISATLSSTGTTSLSIHAGEALHGDLGAIRPNDVALLISKSGQTREVLEVVPFLKEQANRIIAITNDASSSLSALADISLSMETLSEGCPLNLAPMTSSTATLAIGDALAAALIVANDFKQESFARFHPGGMLGWMLTATVEGMIDRKNNPVLPSTATMREGVTQLVDSRLGGVSVVNESGALIGLITDGDLKRIILQDDPGWIDAAVTNYIQTAPTSIPLGASAAEALDLMENRDKQISILAVVDEHNAPVGILRLHDVIRTHL